MAGVFMHVFDYAPRAEAWQPCRLSRAAESWCAQYADRRSASVVNSQLRNLFTTKDGPPENLGGFILHPAHVLSMLRCSWTNDVGSVQLFCGANSAAGCLAGCRGSHEEAWCETDHPTRTCAYGPQSLAMFMRSHVAKNRLPCCDPNGGYNELVLDTDVWASQMPHAISAVFYYEGGGDAARSHAAAVRGAFVAKFGLHRADVPLLMLRGRVEGWRRGFYISGDTPLELADLSERT